MLVLLDTVIIDQSKPRETGLLMQTAYLITNIVKNSEYRIRI